MMKSVIFKAPVLTQSGYGVHSRQVARWLLEKEQRGEISVQFIATQWGDTPWIINKESHAGLIGKIMEKTVQKPTHQPDVSIQLLLPNEWDTTLAKFNVGMSAVVETDRCNPEWIVACNAMNVVIVPSHHAKQCLLTTGNVAVPLHVVPESFSDAIVGTDDDAARALPTFSTPFNFLLFGQITGTNPANDRKNIFFTLKWICEQFKNDPDVGIVLKTNTGRNSLIDRNIVKTMMSQLLLEVRSGPYPRLHILHGDMDDNVVAALYRHPQVKALISLTRGEGYGLPTLEAAASGLPIIATGWSGHMDFLNKGKFINVMYQLMQVHPSRIDGKIFVQGSRWANVSEDDFKRKVQKFKERSTIPREWAAELMKTLQSEYSFESIARQYDAVFKDVL